MIPLHLTDAENAVFELLPARVKEGFAVEEELLTFFDTAQKLELRLRNLSVDHPGLQTLQADARRRKYSHEDIAHIAASLDLSGLSEHDVMELSFAWGPDVFTRMIAIVLPRVSTADDTRALASLAGLRHGILMALSPHSSASSR